MSTMKMQMMMGVCALVTAAAAVPATEASAAAVKIYGGGSSLIAPYWREAMDCYGKPNALVFNSSPPTLLNEPGFNFTGTPAQNCSTQHVKKGYTIRYISTGSGTGIKGFYSGDPTQYGHVDAGDTLYFPSVEYGMSDNSLAGPDVSVYKSGGVEQGLTFVAKGVTPGVGQFANPQEHFGAMIQLPVSIDPVAIAYNPTYEVVTDGSGNPTATYTLNIQHTRTGGGLRLDKNAICKIFNGAITNWNDPALTALNGGVSLEDPDDSTPSGSWSVPLQIVGRSDSSGTTSLMTRFLAAACPTVAGITNAYSDAATTLPSSMTTGGATYNKSTHTMPAETPGKFTIASGSDGVAEAIDYPNAPGSALPSSSTIMYGRIGYIGPDYVAPSVAVTNATPYMLNSADVKNPNSKKWYAPTAANALMAFGSLRPPQSNADGTYNPSSTDRNRKNPQDWVEPPSKFSVLANPTKGYSIVGTTNGLFYTCYHNQQQVNVAAGAVAWYFTSPTVSDPAAGLLSSVGLAPMPAQWGVAIHDTFATNDANLNLNFGVAGDTTSKQCKKITGGGGNAG